MERRSPHYNSATSVERIYSSFCIVVSSRCILKPASVTLDSALSVISDALTTIALCSVRGITVVQSAKFKLGQGWGFEKVN